jgi:hypothetical protein
VKRPEQMVEVARLGRVATLLPEAQAKRAATQKVNTQAVWDWNPSDLPAWLTSKFYSTKVKPRLGSVFELLPDRRQYNQNSTNRLIDF